MSWQSFPIALTLATLFTVQASVQRPWGESAFGYGSRYNVSQYHDAGLADVRHLGWSWTNPSYGPAPVCLESNGDRGESSCGSISRDTCADLGGAKFQIPTCMERDRPFTVVGPDCWNGKCPTDGIKARSDCSILGGEYDKHAIFRTATTTKVASWCYIPGQRTVIGPSCYGKTCYTEELQSACNQLGGQIFSDLYCIVDSKYTVIGPVCQPNDEEEICFPEETIDTCNKLGGVNIADRFCVIEGDYSVLGPFCFGTQSNNTDFEYCFPEAGQEACDTLNGSSFGNGLFCAIEGSNTHLLSTSKGGGSYTTIDRKCKEKLGGISLTSFSCIFQGDYTVGLPTTWGDTFMWPESADDIRRRVCVGGALQNLRTQLLQAKLPRWK